jgi:hypothetical protein
MRCALALVLALSLAFAGVAAAKTIDNPKGTLSVVKYVSSSTGSPVRPGGPATQVLKFSALDAGTTAMTLSYVGPGRNAKVAKTLRLTVKVTKT